LLAASRSWALLSGRDYVIPEDVQAVFVPTAAHRLVPGRGSHREAIARAILAETAVP
jgi:MoxR-like ATPase